ncbi:MAG: hypothetical protein ABNH02_12400 [Pseudomonadales bacterium]|jgi:hypothetical protein
MDLEIQRSITPPIPLLDLRLSDREHTLKLPNSQQPLYNEVTVKLLADGFLAWLDAPSST